MQMLSPQTARSLRHTQRQGSTLIIVVALLGMLAFLGFVFYTFAKQERANAATFSQGAKNLKSTSADPNVFFDYALQQIILGPQDSDVQSILWGGRHSMLANMFGRDGVPWNGEGVGLMQDTAGNPFVDMNSNDSSADANDNQSLLAIVDSPAANPAWTYGSSGVNWGTNKRFRGSAALDQTQDLPEPDVNYNSPDLNTMFVSYDGTAIGAGGANPTRVLVPSFLRPQYLRSGGAPIAQWYLNSAANQCMRPHPSHMCVGVNSSGTPYVTTTPRYVNSTEMDTSVTPNRPMYRSLNLRQPFTFSNFAPPDPVGNAAPNGYLGNWNGGTNLGTSNGVTQYEYDLDVDTDGDGVNDAILMDLGYPPIRRGDGKLIVPLFAINIRDLNGLINLNATGNLAGNNNIDPASPHPVSSTFPLGFRVLPGLATATPDNLSKSNLGMSTNEINPQRALTADPVNDTQLASSQAAIQLAYFLKLFDPTVSVTPPQAGRSIAELANLEWLMLNIGTTNFQLGVFQSGGSLLNSASDLLVGRNGEPGLLRNYLSTAVTNDQPHPGYSTAWTSGTPSNWSVASAPTLNPNSDDNFNYDEGESAYNIRYVTPLDFRGSGQQFQRYNWGPDKQPGVAGIDDDGDGLIDNITEEGWPASDDTIIYGKHPELYQRTGSPLYWPIFSGYQSFFGSTAGGVRWGESQSTPNYFSSGKSLLMQSSTPYSLLDEPTEAIVDRTLMSSAYNSYFNYLSSLSSNWTLTIAAVQNAIGYDGILGTEEVQFLQGTSATTGSSVARSRLAQLMPANMTASQNAMDIRKRFTTFSQDRREFGFVDSLVGGLRSWESSPQFPPSLSGGTPNPYRAELFYYMEQVANSFSPSLKLNVNRWLVYDAGTTNYGFVQLPEQTSVNDTAATTARQQMARDIYTLLYTLCCVHGTPTAVDLDYRTIPLANLPTKAQAKEMAQFAVNLVDSLDTDNIITAFYYDPDLSNNVGPNNAAGWDPLAFVGNDTQPQTSDDYVVYGVERQQLVFSEAAVFNVQYGTDSKTTIFDDALTNKTKGRWYLFFELQNVSPMNVTLASNSVTWSNAATNGNWRVSLYDPTYPVPALLNQVYFLPGLDSTNNYIAHTSGTDLVLPSGALFSVASQDGTDLFSGLPRTSDLRYDPTNTGTSYPLAVPSATANGAADAPVPTPATTAGMFVPRCNLDLVWNYGDATATRFWLKNGSDGTTGLPVSPGQFVSPLLTSGLSAAAATAVRLTLDTQAAAGTNPNHDVFTTWTTSTWVAVDNTTNNTVGAAPLDMPITSIAPSTVAPSIAVSFPRTVPLLSGTAPAIATVSNLNTPSIAPIASTNYIPWQSQNDRDFHSISELLQLPLYGADQLTASLAQVNTPGSQTISPTISNGLFHTQKGTTQYVPTTAAARFLHPENPDYTLNVMTPNYGNRWYRLLNFLEVPNRSNQHQAILGIPPAVSVFPSATTVVIGAADASGRTPVTFNYPGSPGITALSPPSNMLTGAFKLPEYYGWPVNQGQINLNMVRHPEVLNALLDDDQLINDPRFVSTASQFLDDATGDTARQWWVEFLKSRESRYVKTPGTPFPVDPIALLYMPGTANARPFRSVDSIGPIALNTTTLDSPLENTILRSLPVDAATAASANDSRRLFEVGNTTDHVSPTLNEVAAAPLHPSVRYRLLSKLLNNTTSRSNSFAVFITVQYYEAAEVGSGTATPIVRIGGQSADMSANRAIFIVDRTGAIEQMKTLATNVATATIPTPTNVTFPVSAASYSFQPNTDTSGQRTKMNGIRWRDLVIHRQPLN